MCFVWGNSNGFRMQCSNCRATWPVDARYCGQCGAALARVCAACSQINPSEAKYCLACGSGLQTAVQSPKSSVDKPPGAWAKPEIPHPTQPERRQLTVLFCDMVGSSALSTRLDPEEQRDVISEFQTCCATGIKHLGGMVAQYLGDGVLAYFGYPAAHEDDAERAVRASLAILGVVGTLQPARGVTLQARIGIASGVVVVGDLVREGLTQENAAIGETTNLAARLQALAKPNTIVIAPDTYRLVGALFEYRDLGRHALKGFAETVQVRQVLRSSEVENRFDAQHQSGTSPLLGRQEEIELILRRWERAKIGEGQVVLLSGEAGIGKSRASRALRDCLGSEPHTPLSYFCSPYHRESALHPFISQLSRASGIGGDDSPETKLDKLVALLARSSANLAQDVPLLAALLSIPSGRHPSPNATPKQLKERTLIAMVAQLQQLCAQQAVLMTFEDLHWIDPTSLELLTRIIDLAPALPLMVIATARPEFAPPWPRHRHTSIMSLSCLGRSEGQALILGITEGKCLPPVVMEQILAKTDGVPLFIEELTKTVLESGLLRDAGGRYELCGPLPPLAIPSTLHASLLARLDRLAAVKDVAQVGATIGREFSYNLLEAVAAIPEQDLLAALGQLVDAGLIFKRGEPPDATFKFKHALVQDAAYTSLVRSRRQQLHAKIVSQLTARCDSEEEMDLGVLGHHCAEAGMITDALTHYFRAGVRSAARSALPEATSLFDKALELARQLPPSAELDRRELEVQCAHGAVLLTEKGYADVQITKTYSRARELWGRLDHPAEFMNVPWGQWAFSINRSEFDAASTYAEDLLKISNDNHDACGLLLGNCSVGTTHVQQGQPELARQYLKEVNRLYNPDMHSQLVRLAGVDIGIFAKGFLGLSLLCLGHLDQAINCTAEAVRQARAFGHAPTLAQSLALGVRTALLIRSDEYLARWTEELSALTREYGYPHWSSQASIFEGRIQILHGEFLSGFALIDQGLAAYRATGATLWAPYFDILKSEALQLGGRQEEALRVLEENRTTAATTRSHIFTSEIHRRRGQLLLNALEPMPGAAETQFRLAIDVARSQSAKLWELRAAINLSVLMSSQGRYSEARNLLAPIFNGFTEGFNFPDLTEAKTLLFAIKR